MHFSIGEKMLQYLEAEIMQFQKQWNLHNCKSVTILTNGKKAPEYRSENIKINENPVKEFIGNEKIDKIEFENNDKII